MVSRRKPGSTNPRQEHLTNGSRLSPGSHCGEGWREACDPPHNGRARRSGHERGRGGDGGGGERFHSPQPVGGSPRGPPPPKWRPPPPSARRAIPHPAPPNPPPPFCGSPTKSRAPPISPSLP